MDKGHKCNYIKVFTCNTPKKQSVMWVCLYCDRKREIFLWK